MEKISGIIPSSPRVAAVDLKEATPVRPGTPAFGRPESVSALKAATREMGLATTQKAMNAKQDVMDWRTKDSKQAVIAAELSNKFFVKNQKSAGPMQPEEPSPINTSTLLATANEVASRPAGFKTDSTGSFRAAQDRFSAPMSFLEAEEFEETPGLGQPDGLYPKGSFIDRTA
jgi:hypothetical protein